MKQSEDFETHQGTSNFWVGTTQKDKNTKEERLFSYYFVSDQPLPDP